MVQEDYYEEPACIEVVDTQIDTNTEADIPAGRRGAPDRQPDSTMPDCLGELEEMINGEPIVGEELAREVAKAAGDSKVDAVEPEIVPETGDTGGTECAEEHTASTGWQQDTCWSQWVAGGRRHRWRLAEFSTLVFRPSLVAAAWHVGRCFNGVSDLGSF